MNPSRLACIAIGCLVGCFSPALAQSVQNYGPPQVNRGGTEVGDFDSRKRWYSAPREIQIIDERPLVRDFREAPSTKPRLLPPAPGITTENKNKPASSVDDWVDEFDPKASEGTMQVIDKRPVSAIFDDPPERSTSAACTDSKALNYEQIQRAMGDPRIRSIVDRIWKGSLPSQDGDYFTPQEWQLIQQRGVLDPSGNRSYLWQDQPYGDD